ncbi:MAG: FecR domain-containing protein [Myxococcales bacterium]|nr:FecR domain-containing protein [Myxococcales bacterium]
MSTNGCPSPIELERAFDAADPGETVREHLDACPRCASRWEALQQLADDAAELGAVLDAPVRDAPDHAQARAALLAAAGASMPARGPRPRPRALPVVGAAAALLLLSGAALAATLALRGGGPAQHATVTALDAAAFAHFGDTHDEVIRVTQGRVLVDVSPLDSDERLRVIVGESEIEVVGTAFEVRADRDTLRELRVFHGRVELREAGVTQTFEAGDRLTRPGTAAPIVANAGAPAAATPDARGDGADVAVQLPEAAPAAGAPVTATNAPAALTAAREADHVAAAARPSPGRGSAAARATAAPRSQAVAAPRPVREAAAPGGAGAPPPEPARSVEAATAGTRREAEPEAEREFRAGWAALQSGDFATAADWFGGASRRGAALSDDAAFWRVVSLARGGRTQAAAADAGALLARSPAHPRAAELHLLLGGWYSADGRAADAYRELSVAAADHGDVGRAARAALERLQSSAGAE